MSGSQGAGRERMQGPPFTPIAADKEVYGECSFRECDNKAYYRICVTQFTEPVFACRECSDLHFDREIDHSLLQRDVERRLRSLSTEPAHPEDSP